MTFRRITIVGLGLIGGSLAGACRRAFPRAQIIGVTRNRRALAIAKKRKWIHEGFTDLGKWGRFYLKNRTVPILVVLCTPVDTLKDFLRRLDRIAPPGTMVTDTGSVKGFLVRWADRRRWRRIRFVGAHPMAGSHERGIDHAEAGLFKRAVTFVTPGRKNRTVPMILNFWRKISGRVVLVSPEKHDRITAEISHLPHLLASLLVESVSSRSLPFRAAGFLDTTRVAASDPGLWTPILTENRRELKRALARFEKGLARVKRILKKGDSRALAGILRRIQRRRTSL